MIFSHTHRLVPGPMVTRELSVSNCWEQIQEPTDKHYVERAQVGNLQWVPLIETPATPQKRAKKNCKSQQGQEFKESRIYRIY